jgi:Meiotically Up-regulated Gene 113 (MUG113) protein
VLILHLVFHTKGHGFDSRIPRQNSKRGEPLSNPKEIGRTERIAETVQLLSVADIVPPYTAFDITEEMLAEYIRVYGSLGPKGNGKFQYGYARKLAGLELLRLKFHRGAKAKDCKEGMVYLISNPTWPGLLKIGMTTDIDSRLESYQIYDPYKRFRVEHYDFCLDRRTAEQQLLEKFDVHLVDGEWVKIPDALGVIKVLRNY